MVPTRMRFRCAMIGTPDFSSEWYVPKFHLIGLREDVSAPFGLYHGQGPLILKHKVEGCRYVGWQVLFLFACVLLPIPYTLPLVETVEKG